MSEPGACAYCGSRQPYPHNGIVESNTDIRPGRTMPSIDGQPGKVIDYLWFGETFVVTPGCGCREERP